MKDIIRELKEQDMREYTSLPFWSWNNDLDDDELIAQKGRYYRLYTGNFAENS